MSAYSGFDPAAGPFQFMTSDQLRSELRVLAEQSYSTGADTAARRKAIRDELVRRGVLIIRTTTSYEWK